MSSEARGACDVSVIVPVFQAERTLAACVEGLLAQDTPARVEYLLIDNNSTDGSAGIAARYPGIRWLQEPRQGAYAARNRGLSEASGPLIAFTDPDCVPRPDWIEALRRPFADERIQLVQGRSRFARRGPLLDLLDEYERARDEEVFASDDPQLYYGRTNNLAVRASMFAAVGPFEERQRGSDTILARRAVDRYSCAAMTYRASAEVRHLEIGSARDWYRKIYTYGRSCAGYGRIVSVRAPDSAMRRRIIERTRRQAGLSWPRAACLRALLGLEGAAWVLGSRRGRAAAPTAEAG